MQRRLEAARAARRARIDRLNDNTPPSFSHRTFFQIFVVSSLAGALLLFILGTSLVIVASIPLIRLIPSLHRSSPLVPLNSLIPLSPSLKKFSPSLYRHLAKQKAEQQAFVNRYQAKKKADRDMENCIFDHLPHEQPVPNGAVIVTIGPGDEGRARLLCQDIQRQRSPR